MEPRDIGKTSPQCIQPGEKPPTSAAPTQREKTERPSRTPIFWMAVCLAATLIVIKASHFDPPASWQPGDIWHYVRDILIATAADNLFALTIGLLATANLAILPKRAAGRPYAVAYWMLFCILCVLYSVVNAYVFAFAKSPVTRDLVATAGKWSDIRSSVVFFIDAQAIAALIGGPAAFAVGTWVLHRFVGPPRGRFGKRTILLLAMAVAVQCAFAASAQRGWTKRQDRRIAMNPQWALFASYVLGQGDYAPHYPRDFPADYQNDFLTISQRAARGATQPADYKRPFSGHPRNVIVFVLESTSTQYLHLYHSPFPTTPNLDAEAAHSLVFDQFYSHVGLTPQALVEISNSNYARLRPPPQFDTQTLLQPGTALSKVLKSHGFRTMAATASYFTFAREREFVQANGFDQIFDARDLSGREASSWGKADGAMVDKVLQWLDTDPGHAKPFFALCWTNETHHPYHRADEHEMKYFVGGFNFPAPADPMTINAALNCLLNADRQIGRLLAGLRQRGLADDTLVVITGDHGEAINNPHPSSFGHGFHVFEETVHVPCILWNPRLFSPGRRLDTFGGHIDLAPTIADILGIEPAGSWQGYSLFDPARLSRVYFCGIIRDFVLGVREGDWKYVYNATTGFDELYNLQADPQEMNDVFASHPEICHTLRGRVAAWAHYLEGIQAGGP
jgi:arylsulfatase A-like enzyme